MIPVISVVGKSNSGKTTLLEKLLKEIKRRGYRVATVKHHFHETDVDQPGKDSWRHSQAGADLVVLASPKQLVFKHQVEEEVSLDEIVAQIQGVDLILTEGYKRGNKPKIEVFRSGVHQELLCHPKELIAIASDVSFDNGVPCFGLDDASGLIDLVEGLYLNRSRKLY